MWFATPVVETPRVVEALMAKTPREKRVRAIEPREKTAKPKNDPALIAQARELRDRWLEAINERDGVSAVLPTRAKYEVSREVTRAIASRAREPVELIDVAIAPPLLPAA